MATENHDSGRVPEADVLPGPPPEQNTPLTRFFGCVGANFLVIVVVLALVAAYVILRTPASDLSSMRELDVALAGGQPALVEFYSNT